MIVIDGNDGIGKSTICKELQQRGYNVVDRGLPTKLTDNPDLEPDPERFDDIYCILDAPVEVSRERLAAAGKDMNEHWHTVETLTHYRKRFQEVSSWLGVPLIDSTGTKEQTLVKVLKYLDIKPTIRVGLPKGRLFGVADEWLGRAGYTIDPKGRNYRPKCSDPQIEPFILKPRALPQMVALGLLDAAITGKDLIQESIYCGHLHVVAKLREPRVRICVAASPQGTPKRVPAVVATEFPNIASRWMLEHGIAHVIIQTYGSTEAYAPVFADYVVDVVETSQTLKDNGLEILEEVLDSSPVLITRKKSAASQHQFTRRMWETAK